MAGPGCALTTFSASCCTWHRTYCPRSRQDFKIPRIEWARGFTQVETVTNLKGQSA